MCSRLQYYCLVQIISRIGATWYQLQYGFVETIDMSDASPFEMFVFSTQFILTPSAGIGYLIVFLTMQPEAYQHYQDLIKKIEKKLHCKLCSTCINVEKNNSNQLKQSHSCKYFCCYFCYCYCCCCSSLPSPPKKLRKVVYRQSDDDTITTIEQRLVEDIIIRNNDNGNYNNRNDNNSYDLSNESGSENSKRHNILGEIKLSRDSSIDRENEESYTSSYFIDDQDLAEELERMYREGKCGIITIN